MTEEQLKEFKELLLEKKKQLIDEASKTIGTNIAQRENGGKDFIDLAVNESDRNFILRLRDRERKLLAKIEEALKRIEKGTFGICESCGKEIGIKRLQARPVATLCIECKEKQEAEENR